MRHGTIFAQTGKELIPQWHSQYFSQILPFVIPYMVSGPDYSFFEQATRWRRRDVGGLPSSSVGDGCEVHCRLRSTVRVAVPTGLVCSADYT